MNTRKLIPERLIVLTFFAEYMQYLADNHYTVIAMRDLATYVAP